MISKYNDFLLEKEFNSITDDIFRIVESDGVWTSPNTIEWDMTKKEPNKSKNIIDTSLEKLKNFIHKLDKTQLKNYYERLVNKLKNLPDRIRRFLIVHYTSVFLAVASFGFLIGNDDNLEDKSTIKVEQTIDPQIKKEIIELHKKSSFEKAQSSVKEVEAGYSDDRNDTGNWIEVPGYGKRFVGTNHGISAPILQKYLGRIPKREDMENLSYKTALEIYKKDYWDAQNLSMICDQSVANVIYDGCVNQGIDGMSQVIRDAAKENGIDLTGSVYSKSNIRRLNSLNQVELFNSIKKFRGLRYKEAPTWHIHGDGWMNRLSSIEYQTNNQA
jgi:lysozyme family protein